MGEWSTRGRDQRGQGSPLTHPFTALPCPPPCCPTHLMQGTMMLFIPPSLTLILRQRLDRVWRLIFVTLRTCTHCVATPICVSLTCFTSAVCVCVCVCVCACACVCAIEDKRVFRAPYTGPCERKNSGHIIPTYPFSLPLSLSPTLPLTLPPSPSLLTIYGSLPC